VAGRLPTRIVREIIGSMRIGTEAQDKFSPEYKSLALWLIGAGWDTEYDFERDIYWFRHAVVDQGRKMPIQEAFAVQQSLDALEGIE